MLVLSRQLDESVMIGDEIEVTVVAIRGDKVRLGINAPKEISVHRKEVYDAIRRENRQAACGEPGRAAEVVPGSVVSAEGTVDPLSRVGPESRKFIKTHHDL